MVPALSPNKLRFRGARARASLRDRASYRVKRVDPKGSEVRTADVSCSLGSTIEPDRHAWLEAGWIPQIEAQAQRIAVVIANRTLGLPSREGAERAKLGDQGWRLLRRT